MVAILPDTAEVGRTRPALIDCDLHNELHNDIESVLPYLPERWREHIQTFGPRSPAGGYYPRFLDHREEFRPPSGRRSGSDVGQMRARYLDPYNVAYAVLIPLSGAAGLQSHELAGAVATGVNDWQIAEWLDHDSRLRASIVVAHEAPDLAVEEIRRRSGDRRFVQVQFSGRPQEPMGRRKYWPIYAACEEYGLPVMSHAFGSYGQPITGTGWPSFYLEEHVGPAQAMEEPQRPRHFRASYSTSSATSSTTSSSPATSPTGTPTNPTPASRSTCRRRSSRRSTTTTRQSFIGWEARKSAAG